MFDHLITINQDHHLHHAVVSLIQRSFMEVFQSSLATGDSSR